MKKINTILLIIVLALIVPSTGCMIYHKPDFTGQILDIDTKLPIEEAVVVAVYHKRLVGLGAGTVDSIINVRETLTDSKGHFQIPSYTTLITPFAWAIDTSFIIFKPGYASLDMRLEKEFSGITTQVHEGSWPWSKELRFLLNGSGAVEIPKLKTKEDLVKRTLGFPVGFGAKELPLLYRAYESEEFDPAKRK